MLLRAFVMISVALLFVVENGAPISGHRLGLTTGSVSKSTEHRF